MIACGIFNKLKFTNKEERYVMFIACIMNIKEGDENYKIVWGMEWTIQKINLRKDIRYFIYNCSLNGYGQNVAIIS